MELTKEQLDLYVDDLFEIIEISIDDYSGEDRIALLKGLSNKIEDVINGHSN